MSGILSLSERVDNLKRLFSDKISDSPSLCGFKNAQEVYNEIIDLYQTTMNSQSLCRLTERFCEFVQRKNNLSSNDDGLEMLSQKQKKSFQCHVCEQHFDVSIQTYNMIVKNIKDLRDLQILDQKQLQTQSKTKLSKNHLVEENVKIQCYDMLEKTKCYQRRRKELIERLEAHQKLREQIMLIKNKVKPSKSQSSLKK